MNVPNGAGQKSSVRTHNTTAISEAEHLKFSVYYHTWALIYFLSSSSSSSRMTLTPLNNAGGSSCHNHGWGHTLTRDCYIISTSSDLTVFVCSCVFLTSLFSFWSLPISHVMPWLTEIFAPFP